MRLTLALAVLLLSAFSVQSQIRFRVATGLSTDWITSDNPATARLASAGEGSEFDTPGGAFDGAQMGWGLRVYVDLDKQKKFRIPLGVDYNSFAGSQSISGPRYSLRVSHSNQLWTTFTGFEWSFIEFPWAFARVYLGAEARLLNVGANTITTSGRTIVDDEIIPLFSEYNGKPSTWRLGGLARLGIEGEIYYPVFINTSIGWGAMNLVGRDTRPTSEGGRGELLTPVRLNESGEAVLYHVNFTFMVQVRL